MQLGEERLSQGQTPKQSWDPSKKRGLSVEVTGCAGVEGELELLPPNQKNPGYCPRLLLPAVGSRVSEVFVLDKDSWWC